VLIKKRLWKRFGNKQILCQVGSNIKRCEASLSLRQIERGRFGLSVKIFKNHVRGNLVKILGTKSPAPSSVTRNFDFYKRPN
jgi:hypothetical protein